MVLVRRSKEYVDAAVVDSNLHESIEPDTSFPETARVD